MQPLGSPEWDIELDFRVSGAKAGADGFALWLTSTPLTEGPMFGSQPTFEGLCIFFDTFDNDWKRDNPYVGVIVNDGTKELDFSLDGKDNSVGGCMMRFRNPRGHSKAKITYEARNLDGA